MRLPCICSYRVGYEDSYACRLVLGVHEDTTDGQQFVAGWFRYSAPTPDEPGPELLPWTVRFDK